MEEYTKLIGGILGYIKITEEGFKSSLDKFFDDEIRDELKKYFNLQVNDTLFIVASEKAPKIMGQLRIKLGEELELTDKNKYAFCIVNDFPFFERDDDGNLAFCHNPFSMMQGGMKALEEQNPDDILAYQYDFVCNGNEMASGAIRNHDLESLAKGFHVVGYSREEVEERFKSIFTAFKYGCPPHGGMAPGIDRILMLIKDEPNLREVQAFPPSASGADAMMGSPSELTTKQLKELGIKIEVK